MKYPDHDNVKEILAKISINGRAYAAAIERRKKYHHHKGDRFHQQIVGPQMLSAGIDEWLLPLHKLKQPSLENADQILRAHKKLTYLFCNMTGLEKRSLASKYLHFHFPNLFFLFDSRAAQELSKISPPLKQKVRLKEHDGPYATYFFRCLDLVTRISKEHGISLNPRQLDNYLLGYDTEL